MKHVAANENESSLALVIIPPVQEKDDAVTLEAAMQSLVLDKDHPLALELAGTAASRAFIVRATRQASLAHAAATLRSQYPQLEVRPLRTFEDPFRLEPHEAVSAVELGEGGASYLPLSTWQETPKGQERIDPVLGLLAALSDLPAGTRSIAQIALVPAAIDWAKGDQRKAIEHALQPEMRAERRRNQKDMLAARYENGFTGPILGIALCLGLIGLVRSYLPPWMLPALSNILTGHDPHLSQSQSLELGLYAFGLIAAIIAFIVVANVIISLFNRRQIYDMRMVAKKTTKMTYHARVRLYVIGPRLPSPQADRPSHWEQVQHEREQAEEREETLLRLIAAYRQFNQSGGAYFVPKRITGHEAVRLLSHNPLKHTYGWREHVSTSKHLLSVDALAALWHFPSGAILPDLALVEHRRARSLLMPAELARLSTGFPTVGYSEHGGYRLPFALSPQFFTMHTLIAGKSGEGKSTCMEYIAREAMSQGGLILIDPHGDLCDHVLRLVPPHRSEDVVLVDLSESEGSFGINPLDVTLGRGRDKAISDLLKTLAHIWVSAWGPRMENAFEMALRTLFEANKILVAQDPQEGPMQQYTLMDVLPLLTSENFCHALLQEIDDDYLHRWWREYYEPLTLIQQREVVNPVITKVAKFESVIARRIIGQGHSTLNFAQMISERKILLFKLAKGVVGSDVAALLGATMLSLLQITLEEQGSKELQERVRYPIMLDEFQVLAGVDYGALAELRKYGATFFLATQSLEYLQKLDPLLLPTVLANVKQLIIFHLSAKDSETLYQDLGVGLEDILNLEMHTCYVKLSAGNRRQPTFSLKMLPPNDGDAILAESIRARCRVRYTRPVAEVDEMLHLGMIRNLRLAPSSGRASSFNQPRRRPSGPPHSTQRNPSAPHHTNQRLDPSTPPAHHPTPASEVIELPAATLPEWQKEEEAPSRNQKRAQRSRERAEKHRQALEQRHLEAPEEVEVNILKQSEDNREPRAY